MIIVIYLLSAFQFLAKAGVQLLVGLIDLLDLRILVLTGSHPRTHFVCLTRALQKQIVVGLTASGTGGERKVHHMLGTMGMEIEYTTRNHLNVSISRKEFQPEIDR